MGRVSQKSACPLYPSEIMYPATAFRGAIGVRCPDLGVFFVGSFPCCRGSFAHAQLILDSPATVDKYDVPYIFTEIASQ